MNNHGDRPTRSASVWGRRLRGVAGYLPSYRPAADPHPPLPTTISTFTNPPAQPERWATWSVVSVPIIPPVPQWKHIHSPLPRSLSATCWITRLAPSRLTDGNPQADASRGRLLGNRPSNASVLLSEGARMPPSLT